ncbi:MAG: hypothetical protein K2W84_05415 [Burkholderiales bacterium]|nr:hypothetical protein [Burkholderiales bacterium]
MSIREVISALQSTRRIFAVRQILLHVLVTVLAVAIAFSIPKAAGYVLYEWWPKVAGDTNLLIATEVGFAAVLVLLFNILQMAWEDRSRLRAAEMASLVHASQGASRMTSRRERQLAGKLGISRDAFILTLTGYDTFSAESSLLRDQLMNAYEIRVLLLNPGAPSTRNHVGALPDAVTLRTFHEEVQASLAYLQSLAALGKKVAVRFYEHKPFWKVAVLGEHVWVQYCHSGAEIKNEPEFVFALNRSKPRLGFYVPFYMYFLDCWENPENPEYDFETRELVYRDGLGQELRRTAFDEGHAPERQRRVASG